MIIGLTGAAFAGKDTVGNYLSSRHNFVTLGFADPIRDGLMAMLEIEPRGFSSENKEQIIGWIGQSPRQLMQSLGTEWGRELVSKTLWTDRTARRIRTATRAGDDVVITDVRFKTEADLIHKLGGELWRIHRPGAETTQHSSHASEREAQNIPVARHLMNSGTLEHLYEQIDSALDNLYEIAGATAF